MTEIILSEKVKWYWDREFKCPECGGSHFGTSAPPGKVSTGVCHDQFGIGCRFRWPRSEDEKYFVLGGQE